MRKPLLISAGIFFIIGIIAFASALIGMGEFDFDENTIYDSAADEGMQEFDNPTSTEFGFSVYVEGGEDCSTVEINLIKGGKNYFEKDCDEFLDEAGWTYVGMTSAMARGTFEVNSSHPFIIVDDSEFLSYGLALFGGSGCCFIGFILLLIGLFTGKKANQQVIIVGQQGMIEPGMQQTVIQQPGIQQPGMQQTVIQQPGIQQPGIQQPAMGYQTVAQPYSQPTAADPAPAVSSPQPQSVEGWITPDHVVDSGATHDETPESGA